jgi:hypothetical protein
MHVPTFRPFRFSAALTLSLSLLAGVAYGAGVSPDAATAEQSSQASDKYRAGVEALDAGKLDQALTLFRASYDLVASPNSRLMIGRVLARLGKTVEAYREIESAVIEADRAAERSEKYRKTASAARTELQELKGKVGLVVVQLKTAVSVGGTEIAASDLGKPVVVAPGKVEVVVRSPGGEEERRTVDVLAGKPTTIDVAPPAAAPATGSVAPAAPCPAAAPAPAQPTGIDQRTLAWVAGGVGLAGLTTFAVFGALNNKTYSELKKDCVGDVCPRSSSDDAERGRTYQTLANVGLGVAVVGLGSGLVLAITAPKSAGGDARNTRTPEVRVGPRAISVAGRF